MLHAASAVPTIGSKTCPAVDHTYSAETIRSRPGLYSSTCEKTQNSWSRRSDCWSLPIPMRVSRCVGRDTGRLHITRKFRHSSKGKVMAKQVLPFDITIMDRHVGWFSSRQQTVLFGIKRDRIFQMRRHKFCKTWQRINAFTLS